MGAHYFHIIYFQEHSTTEKTVTFEGTSAVSGERPATSEEPRKKKAQKISKKTGINVVPEKASNLQVLQGEADSATTTQTTSSMNLAETSTTVSGFVPETEGAANIHEANISEAMEAGVRKISTGAVDRATTNVSMLGVRIAPTFV